MIFRRIDRRAAVVKGKTWEVPSGGTEKGTIGCLADQSVSRNPIIAAFTSVARSCWVQ